MIYTIVPIEQVLSYANTEQTEAQSSQAVYMGENVLLSSNKNGEFYIDKLLSTNPQSFLKSEFYPGVKADIKKIIPF